MTTAFADRFCVRGHLVLTSVSRIKLCPAKPPKLQSLRLCW